MKILVIFTYNMGIKKWKEIGMYDREISLYKEYAKKHKIIFLTYDDKQEIKDFTTINKQGKNPLLYSLKNKHDLIKEVDVIKTNQVLGSWTAVRIAKKHAKPLLVRQGYQLSKFEKGWKKLLAVIVEKYAYNNADAIVCTSKEDANYIRNAYG